MANGWIGNIWKKYCEPHEIEGRLKWEKPVSDGLFLFSNNRLNTIYSIKLLYNSEYFTRYGILIMKSRNGLIAKIKVAQKELGMAEEAYRAMLLRITGKNSCAVMDIGELERVADEMRRFGFKPSTSTAREKHGRPHLRRTTAAAMMDKVEALLADGGYHWNYAHAMARRMFGCEKVEYLDNDQLHKLVAALQIAANRRKGK